ncbi:MAG: LysR family transcriptional regulator substrate-binding protein [Chthoniobacterales bacterium]
MFLSSQIQTLELAIMVQPIGEQAAGIEFELLRTYPLCVAVSPAHPFARLKSIPLEKVAAEPNSLLIEVEAGRGIALSIPVFKLVTGKHLLYRPVTGKTVSVSIGIARATKGDVTLAGEKFCEILRKISDGAITPKAKPGRSSETGRTRKKVGTIA